MDVRVMIELLVSRMQNEMRGRLKLACFAKRLIQRSPSRTEQQIVKRLAVAEDQARQLIRQRKDNLEIVDIRNYQFLRLLEPVRTTCTTALRTVAIAARIVNVLARLTLRTFVNVSF